MNKMDKYFKDQLTNYEPAEDGWNIPSDKVWDETLPYLHKKKGKKSIFFLFGLGVFSLILVSVFLFDSTTINLPQTTNKLNTNSQLSKLAPAQDINNPKEESRTAINKELKSNNITVSKNSNTNTSSNFETLKTLAGKPKATIQKNVKTCSIINDNTNNQAIKNLSLEHATQILKAQRNTNSESASNKVQSKFPTTKPIERELSRNFISPLPLAKTNVMLSMSLRPLDTERQLVESKMNVTPLPKTLGTGRQEIGIGFPAYAAHLLPLAAHILEEEGEEINIEGGIQAYNFYYRQFLSPGWSLSTGLFHINGDVDLNLALFDTLTCGDLSVFVEDQLSGQVTERETCLTETGNDDLELYLKEGVTVAESDSLLFFIDARIKLKSLSIPLMLTRHWTLKRVEFTLAGGASLDYYSVRQGEASMDIHRDNESILKEIYIQESLQEKHLDYSLYAESGIRFRLGGNMNLGFSSRLNFRDILTTGAEVSLNYRW